jgi:RHS repeat-associated protein
VARSDAAGNLISRTRYEPYGGTASGVTPTIGFAGHVNDADTGLVYMQQRYYDPVAGRFLSIDPVTTDANTGAGFNRYAYAVNSPYKYIDPDGRDPDHFYGAGVALAGLSPNEQKIWLAGERAAGPLGASAIEGFHSVQGVIETVRTGKVNIAPLLSVVAKTASGKRVENYTSAQNKALKGANATANGGQMACETCGRPLESIKSEKGVPTPPNQAQVHHTTAIEDGGTRDTPGKVLCPTCHQDEHKK